MAQSDSESLWPKNRLMYGEKEIMEPNEAKLVLQATCLGLSKVLTIRENNSLLLITLYSHQMIEQADFNRFKQYGNFTDWTIHFYELLHNKSDLPKILNKLVNLNDLHLTDYQKDINQIFTSISTLKENVSITVEVEDIVEAQLAEIENSSLVENQHLGGNQHLGRNQTYQYYLSEQPPHHLTTPEQENSGLRNAWRSFQKFFSLRNLKGTSKSHSDDNQNQQESTIPEVNVTYNDEDILGRGSRGTAVYKGKFQGRIVAVKRVITDLKNEKSVVEEVINLKICDAHENVVRFFYSEAAPHCVFIVLELCDMSLSDWVANQSIEISHVEVLRQATVGLEWLHSRGVVHRDLKPENILLVAKVKRVKISDFGLSRKLSEENTHVSSVAAGTQGWVAPEILEQIDADYGAQRCHFTFASDVFSLGCVYYYVLTDGKHAFGSPMRRNVNILDGKVEINPKDISRVCTQNMWFIHLMICKDSKSRPSCSDLLRTSLFWTQGISVGFLQQLNVQGILRKMLDFKIPEPCTFNHEREINIFHNLGFKIGAGCVLPVAYLQCQGLRGDLEIYYSSLRPFVTKELCGTNFQTFDSHSSLNMDVSNLVDLPVVNEHSYEITFQKSYKIYLNGKVVTSEADRNGTSEWILKQARLGLTNHVFRTQANNNILTIIPQFGFENAEIDVLSKENTTPGEWAMKFIQLLITRSNLSECLNILCNLHQPEYGQTNYQRKIVQVFNAIPNVNVREVNREV